MQWWIRKAGSIGGNESKKKLDIVEIQNTLLKQMGDYLEGLISKEKYAQDAEQFYSKYGHCIEETEFYEVFSEAIADCYIVNVDELGDEDLKKIFMKLWQIRIRI